VTTIKPTLNDAGSFEHVETLVSPVNSEDIHRMTMKFRAKNAFGGLVLTQAKGKYRDSDCELVDLSYNQKVRTSRPISLPVKPNKNLDKLI